MPVTGPGSQQLAKCARRSAAAAETLCGLRLAKRGFRVLGPAMRTAEARAAAMAAGKIPAALISYFSFTVLASFDKLNNYENFQVNRRLQWLQNFHSAFDIPGCFDF